MSRRVVVASLLAFFASFCILVVELVAGRVMAPHIGMSLYTWTSIIGVCLAGISLGARLGGILADLAPRYITLGMLLVLSGIATLCILPATDYVAGSEYFALSSSGEMPTTTQFMLRIVGLTALLFFVPTFILGMITPVVVKLAISTVETSGNTIGKIYAFATLGSILGTFVTGFYLVEVMGVRAILTTVGVILLFCAPFFGMLFDGVRTTRGDFSVMRVLAWVFFLAGCIWLGQAVMRWYFAVQASEPPDVRKLWETLQAWDNAVPNGDTEAAKDALHAHWVMLLNVAIVGGCFLWAMICWVVGGIGGRPVEPEAKRFDLLEPEPLQEAEPDLSDAKRMVRFACVANFVASFCILAIELVAGRILAPNLGVSLYTWTSIIGVVLAGISLGAYLGGMIADAFPRRATVGWLFFISGLTALAIPVLADTVSGGTELQDYADDYFGITNYYGVEIPLMFRILCVTAMVFFLPSLLLGTISPVVNRLAMHSLKTTGSTVGKVYMWSTLGSILGTFLTGFFLIEFLGTRPVVYAVTAILVLTAPVFGGMFFSIAEFRRVVLAGSLLCLLGALTYITIDREDLARPNVKDDQKWNAEKTKHETDWVQEPDEHGDLKWVRHYRRTKYPAEVMVYKETDYYTIKIRTEEKRAQSEGRLPDEPSKLRTLVLDHLIHSYTDMDAPLHLKYDYLRIYEELVAWRTAKKADRKDYLFVGGGGYTLPRFFDKLYPQSAIDVVEIDPWVTRVATEHLGINETRINTVNLDGRWYAMNCKKKYDYIFGDAFNDLSIPFHLTTVEFDRQLKNLLKPDGILMALVIDSIKDGEFLPSYIKTLQEVFGEDNVDLIVIEKRDVDEIGHETCIVVASLEKLDYADFERFIDNRDHPDPAHKGEKYEPASHLVPHSRLLEYMSDLKKRGRKPIVLTDDYVPADNLIAKLFNERFSFKKKGAD